jgi:hypothetical protein
VPSRRAERLHAAAERLAAACADGSLDAALTANRVQAVILHGSAVDPSVDEPDDLDVAIWCGGDGPADLLGVVAALTDAAGADLDLSLLDDAPVSLVARASTGRGLWEHEPGTIARLQMRFVPQWWDTAWLRRLRLEQLAGR